jgi:acetyl-CoA carboxylase biotin carboxyl carrier protein
MDIKEIQNLIKFVYKSGVEEVKIEKENFKITIKTKANNNQQIIIDDTPQFSIPQPAPPISQQSNPTKTEKTSEIQDKDVSDNQIIIKSPIIGTFYRKPSPDKPTFVEIGQDVKTGDILCVIEAMKLFNEIESDVSGKIVKILVDDQSPVEFDQPLFIIDPS